jgi:hypothetical protein
MAVLLSSAEYTTYNSASFGELKAKGVARRRRQQQLQCMVRRAVALCERRTVARVRRAPGLVAHYSGTVEHSAVPLAGGAGGGSRRPADGTAL